MYFAVRPGLAAESLRTAALNGALFGFFAYATYDLTNQATVRNWTTLSLVDMAWGTSFRPPPRRSASRRRGAWSAKADPP